MDDNDDNGDIDDNEDNQDNEDNEDNDDNRNNDDNEDNEDNDDNQNKTSDQINGVMKRHDMTLKEQSKILVTWDLTLETLITFLAIENKNINIYIVTLE